MLAAGLFVATLAPVLRAADEAEDFRPALAALEQASGGRVDVTRSRRTGLVTFLAVRNGGAGVPAGDGEALAKAGPEASARAFLGSYARLFGLRDAGQLVASRTSPRDAAGMDHVRFRQQEQGVPITGAELIVHLKGSSVVAVNGRTLRVPSDLPLAPTVGPDAARAAARGLLTARLGAPHASLSEPRLEIFDLGLIGGPPMPTRLAWFVEATALDVREFVWVDAHTGGVLKHFSQLTPALNRKIYSANNGSALPGPLLLRQEGQGATGDVDADRAYDYAGDTYTYYKNVHGRDSFDGAGGQITSTVHYCPTQAAQDCPYGNAFWNGVQMVYGENYSRADDVDAHELTHAVTDRTAGLFYYQQSGALNESFSDIFGETVDLTNGHGNDAAGVRWKIAEDVPGLGAIRDMKIPTNFNDPGKLSDSEYVCDETPSAIYADSGGVHTNSGVPNHAYALMVDGGAYNGFNVTGIGLSKAAAIQYRALTEYLFTAADFADDYDALLQSCDDLVGGALGIAASDCTEVERALDAVELADPIPCAPSHVNAPPLCPVGKDPVFVFNDDLENTASGRWSTTAILPAGSAWINGLSNGVGTPPLYHRDYTQSGAFGFSGFDFDLRTDSSVNMTQNVPTPDGTRLYFDHAYGFEHQGATNYDGGVVEYSTNGTTWGAVPKSAFIAGPALGKITTGGDNPLANRDAFVGQSWGYTASIADLSFLTATSARFRFRLGTDSLIADYGWFIDNVRVYTCDVGGTVKLSAASYSVNETAGTLTVTVTRSGGGAPGASIDYATSSGTATEGDDYTGRSGTLTFGSGVTSRTFTVPITNDGLTEGNETFDVTLSNPQGASLVLGSPATAAVTIVDDDLPGTVQFSAATATVSEASAFATITVKRTGGVAGGVTVQYATSNGSAAAGSDYTPAGGTLTFGAGATSQTFQVPITNDTVDEANETVNLALSAPGGGAALGVPSAAVLTITDNDTAGAIQFSASTYSASEAAGGAVITVSRSGGAASGVTVHYATSDGTAASADYTGISGTLSFDAGQTTKTIIVPIANDDLGENNETVRLSLTSPTGGATLGARATALLTIVENETVMQLSAPQYAVAENVSKVTLTVKRSGNVAGASSVHYSLVDATAVAGSDYALATGTLAFAANNTSKTFTVTILNDVVSEAPEFFVVKLDTPVGGVLGPQDTATVLVTDDDAVLALSAATYTVAETATTVTITVKRSGNKASPATVHYATSSGTATEPDDSPGAQGTLNFAVNATSATFKVPIVNDGESEGPETLNIALSGPTGARLGLSAAILTITDDEPVLTLGSAAYSVAETAASSTITVKRNGPTTATATVHYATSDGTATAGSDYTAAGNTLTFNPGVKQLTFTVPILPDTTGEPAETVNIALTSPTGASLGIAAAVLTITDNDPSIAFSAASYSVKESGKTATITVKRTGPTTAPASVHYATSPGSATADSDYTTTAGTLTLPANKSSATFTVPILNDTMDEGAETVLLTLSSSTGGVLGLASATLRIDDDDAATAVKLGASSTSGSESRGAVTLTVTRTGATGIPVTVTYATADGTAVAGTDYLGVSNSVTFAAGETLKVIEIPLFTNGAGSPAKSFTVTLLDPTNGATLAAPQSATVFITP